MKTFLALAALSANSWVTHEAEQPSSIWEQPAPTSQPFRPNPNAGYQGSDLPLNQYNPDVSSYRDRDTLNGAVAPLDGGVYSGQRVIDTPNGQMLCNAPDYNGRTYCR